MEIKLKTNMKTRQILELRKLIEQKKYDEALLLSNQMTGYELDIEYNLEKAQLLKAMSDYTGALELFEKIYNIDKNNIYAVYGMIECLKKHNKIDEILNLTHMLSDEKNIKLFIELFETSINLNNFHVLNKILNYLKENSKPYVGELIESLLLKISNSFEAVTDKIVCDNFIEILRTNIVFLNSNIFTVIKKIATYYKNKMEPEKALNWCAMLDIQNYIESELVTFVIDILRECKIYEDEVDKIINSLNSIYNKLNNTKTKNIILSEIEILQCKTVLQSKPVKMHVVLTTKCNLKCIMCHVRKTEYEINETYQKIIREYIPYLEKISWQGGELFLYDGFMDLVKFAYKNKVSQEFVTNGLLLDDNLIQMISDYGIDLSISIDSVQPETYENIRKGAKFSNLLDVLKKLYAYNVKNKTIKYSMSVVVMSLNYKEIENIINFAIKYDFSTIYFQRYIPKEKQDFLEPSEEEKEYILRKIFEFKKNIEICDKITISTNIGKEFEINTNEKLGVSKTISCKEHSLSGKNDTTKIKEKLFCIAPWKTLFLDCNNFTKFSCYCEPFKTSDKIDKIWNCESIVQYRESIIQNKLYKCCDSFCRNAGEDGVDIRKFGWK